MAGRIRRLQAQAHLAASAVIAEQIIVCPLCERRIPAAQRDAHHLVPRSRGGVRTEFLHRICHRQIHALFTETELARQYHSVEALLSHPEVIRFVNWVRTKPEGFFERTRKSVRIRER